MATIREARGKPLYTSDGERLGDVDMILDDVQTRKPEWFAISTSMLGGKRRLVPVEGADVRSEGVFVSYSMAQVQSTPEIVGTEVNEETERTLYSRYGLGYSRQRSATGLPKRGRKQQAGSGSRSASRRTRQSRRTSEEPTRDELYEEAKRLEIKGRSRMNKAELKRAVGRRARGSAGGGGPRGTSRGKATPIDVQAFLEGVGYPTRTRDLREQAKRQGASAKVRATLDRLPDERFDAPTEVSEAIGKLS